jgi:type IV secretory pathway ATPase VirB11/archaellum biosynthesis ATPase
MLLCDLMWKLFQKTGNVGAYLLYRDYNSYQALEAAAKDPELTKAECLLKENERNGVV